MGYNRSKKIGTMLSVLLMMVATGVSVYFFSSNTNLGDTRSQSVGLNQVAFQGVTPGAKTSTVEDKVPPTAAIKNPLPNAHLKKDTDITIHADAIDTGGISKVDFFINEQLICTDLVQLYTCSWRVPLTSNAKYTILIKVYDNSGNLGSSETKVYAN